MPNHMGACFYLLCNTANLHINNTWHYILTWIITYWYIQGAAYLHSSSFGSHGHIRSSSCLVDSRWQIKLTSFGLNFLKREDQRLQHMGEYEKYKKELWTAPELLRMPECVRPAQGTKAGDVFSFAIILQETLYRAMPYFLETLTSKGKNPCVKCDESFVWYFIKIWRRNSAIAQKLNCYYLSCIILI